MRSTQARRVRPTREAAQDRRPLPARRLLKASLLIMVVGLGVAAVLLWTRLAAFNDETSTASALSSSLLGPMSFGSDPVNILILGYGGPQHDGPYLTDSMNIASIDPATDTTTMIPIPRDLWIEGMPAIPANGKINQAFSLGHLEGGVTAGAERAAAVVADVTGVVITHWIAIDFDGFKAVIDAIGGVTIHNPTEFAYGSPAAFEAGGGWDATFPAGLLQLSGEEALLYARTRYTSDPAQATDYARSERQQRILQAVVERVTGAGIQGIGTALSAMDALDDHLRTDLSVIDLVMLSNALSPDRRIELSEGTILQATTTTDGQYVLVPIGRSSPTDYSPLKRFVQERLSAPAP